MKNLIVILMLLIPIWGFSQTHTFTEKEVQEMDSLFQVYEYNDSIQKLKISLLNTQLLNYTTLHKQDSLHILYLNENVDLLTGRINLYVDLTKELRPKWYNKPAIHFFLGAATIVTSAIVLDKIK
jgi:hypothetical protein|tara:strand:+ start:2363 stop:2737 length:375 start_codon:yes stop_codon:yes gene_type:complete